MILYQLVTVSGHIEDVEQGAIVIVGKVKPVTEVKQRIQEIVEREIKLQQSITEFEETDLPMEKVRLLEEFGILSEIEKKRVHLQIRVQDQGVTFRGPPEECKDAKIELFNAFSSMIENIITDARRGVLQLLQTRTDVVDQLNQHEYSARKSSK